MVYHSVHTYFKYANWIISMHVSYGYSTENDWYFLIHVPRVLVQNQTLHTGSTVGPPGQLGTPSPRPRPGMDHWGIMDSNLWTKCVTVSFESFIKYSSCHVITVEFVALHVFDCLIYSNLLHGGCNLQIKVESHSLWRCCDPKECLCASRPSGEHDCWKTLDWMLDSMEKTIKMVPAQDPTWSTLLVRSFP